MSYPNHSGTKCPKCSNTSFELVEDFPSKSNFKFYYMRCSSCYTFLQALPYLDTNTKIAELANSLDNIKSRVDNVGAVSTQNDQIIIDAMRAGFRQLAQLLEDKGGDKPNK